MPHSTSVTNSLCAPAVCQLAAGCGWRPAAQAPTTQPPVALHSCQPHYVCDRPERMRAGACIRVGRGTHSASLTCPPDRSPGAISSMLPRTLRHNTSRHSTPQHGGSCSGWGAGGGGRIESVLPPGELTEQVRVRVRFARAHSPPPPLSLPPPHTNTPPRLTEQVRVRLALTLTVTLTVTVHHPLFALPLLPASLLPSCTPPPHTHKLQTQLPTHLDGSLNRSASASLSLSQSLSASGMSNSKLLPLPTSLTAARLLPMPVSVCCTR